MSFTQQLLHVRKLQRAQNEPLEVALRRLALEFRVREYRGHSDDGRDELVLHVFPQQDPDEPMRLVERRHLHLPLILEPDAVLLTDDPALDLEDEDAARRVGDDEIRLGEVARFYADLQRMPGEPARREGRRKRLMDLALRGLDLSRKGRVGEEAGGDRIILVQTGKPRVKLLPQHAFISFFFLFIWHTSIFLLVPFQYSPLHIVSDGPIRAQLETP